jgi:hypothetical protein
LLGVAGGVLTLLALLLAGSALRRLALYQDAFGWTVTRITAGTFESWVALVLAGIGASWLVRRTDVLPRMVMGSAAVGLLGLSWAGPDALAASWNVDRFERTGKIDAWYLAQLSDDAVPALQRLPEPARSCVLDGRRVQDDPWNGWNLARSRAATSLRSDPPGAAAPGCAAHSIPGRAGPATK